MEIERSIYDAPKTCFNSVTGKKIADKMVAFSLFSNNWGYCLFENEKDELLDADGKKVAENISLFDASGSMYLVENEDGSRAMRSYDGRVLFDKKRDIIFSPNGWFVVIEQNGEKALYRKDLSLAVKGFLRCRVISHGEYFAAEFEDDLWTFYRADGSIFAQNVKEYQFHSSTFYLLKFADNKTVIYDEEKHSEFVCDAVLPQLMFGHMLKAVSNGNLQLYRSDGTLLIGGHKDYLSFENGMVLVKREDDSLFLFNAEIDVVADMITDIDGGINGEFLKVSAEGQDYLFDNDGKLVFKADKIILCGNNCFLHKEKNQKVGTLHAQDTSVMAEDIIDAIVYKNGWVLLQKTPAMPDSSSYLELKTDEGVFVAASLHDIEYLEEFNAWIEQKDKQNYTLYHGEFGEMLTDMDKIVRIGAMVLARKNNEVDVYSLAQLHEKEPLTGQKTEKKLASLWHGSVEDLAKNVCFCGGDTFGNVSDFLNIFDGCSDMQLCLGIGVMATNDTDDDDEDEQDEEKA